MSVCCCSVLIQAFGLFWRADEVDWSPGKRKSGKGKPGKFRLLGRIGSKPGHLRLADFREQYGIYILYGNYGPHYVGLTRKQGIGKRLKVHLSDRHKGKWDRFSWFGFRQVLTRPGELGLLPLKKMAANTMENPGDVIAEMEAILIRAMALSNKADMRFKRGEPWTQVHLDEVDRYFDKVQS